jgi:hypothetical protein
VHDGCAIDENVPDARGVLMWIVEGGSVLQVVLAEDSDVGCQAALPVRQLPAARM